MEKGSVLDQLFSTKKSGFASTLKSKTAKSKKDTPKATPIEKIDTKESKETSKKPKMYTTEYYKSVLPKTPAYDFTKTYVPESRQGDDNITAKGIRKSYRLAKDSVMGAQIKDRLKEEMIKETK